MKPTYEELQEQLENAQREFRSADITMQKLEAKCEKLAAENAIKQEFIKTCIRAAADGASLDGADIQELGERLGLFGRETYQPVLHGYICGHEAGEDSVYVMKETPATDAFLAEVRASAIPEGYAIVAQQIFLDPSDIESICSQCGDGHESGYGDFTDGLLWVGNIQRDDGSIVHGLHISSADYSEEGGVTVCEFDFGYGTGLKSVGAAGAGHGNLCRSGARLLTRRCLTSSVRCSIAAIRGSGSVARLTIKRRLTICLRLSTKSG